RLRGRLERNQRALIGERGGAAQARVLGVCQGGSQQGRERDGEGDPHGRRRTTSARGRSTTERPIGPERDLRSLLRGPERRASSTAPGADRPPSVPPAARRARG